MINIHVTFNDKDEAGRDEMEAGRRSYMKREKECKAEKNRKSIGFFIRA